MTDKTILHWIIVRDPATGGVTGTPKRSLIGHSNAVQDVVMTGSLRYLAHGVCDMLLCMLPATLSSFLGRFSVVPLTVSDGCL